MCLWIRCSQWHLHSSDSSNFTLIDFLQVPVSGSRYLWQPITSACQALIWGYWKSTLSVWFSSSGWIQSCKFRCCESHWLLTPTRCLILLVRLFDPSVSFQRWNINLLITPGQHMELYLGDLTECNSSVCFGVTDLARYTITFKADL